MTTFFITEKGGWWTAEVQRDSHPKCITLPAEVGILEASAAVQERWRDARLVAIN